VKEVRYAKDVLWETTQDLENNCQDPLTHYCIYDPPIVAELRNQNMQHLKTINQQHEANIQFVSENKKLRKALEVAKEALEFYVKFCEFPDDAQQALDKITELEKE